MFTFTVTHPVRRRLLPALLLALAPTVFAAAASAPARRDGAPKPLFADAAPVIPWEDLRKVSLPNTTIDSVALDATDHSVRVTATVSHPPATDRVKVFIALPTKGWNGRFRGHGGGGFVGGNAGSLRGAVSQGYVAGATDTGHEGGSGSFALGDKGRLNWQDIRDNAYLGIHEMTVTGKALARAFYGKDPKYSYFYGSSTGGRQGLSEAQRFPEDYNGIYSGCPAVNWTHFVPGLLWPQVVMAEAKHLVPKAKLDAVTAAAIAACDAADGISDGVIDDPSRCTWDPQAFVGTKVGEEVFTGDDARVVREMWAGPRGVGGRMIWHGLTRGTDLNALGGSGGAPLAGKPFSVGLDWFRYFLVQDPQWPGTALGKAEFELLQRQSVEQYGAVFGTDNPDLTRFRDHGGKVIIVHGMADQLIPHEGSVDYYRRVQAAMGGPERTAEFARLFLVPGVDHGMRGAGATPVGQMDALLRWVEDGQAPDLIDAEKRDAGGKIIRTRPVYPYPQYAKYRGTGSTDDAANFAPATR